ncbi:MAG: hypothetical protein WAO35_15950 [Terriglobia bacterium]
MRALELIVQILFAIQFVVVLVAVASAMLFAEPQVSHLGRNLR